jgi:serine/threonine protein kinase
MLKGRRFHICEDCGNRVELENREPSPPEKISSHEDQNSDDQNSTLNDTEPYSLGVEIDQTPSMTIYGGWHRESERTVRIQAFNLLASRPASIRKTTEILRQIKHRNLLQVEDAFLLGTSFHLVCEDFVSKDLVQEVEAGARMAHLLHAYFGVLSGLSELHRHGLFHGDLSPQNILIGLTGEVKLGNHPLLRMESGVLTGFVKGRPGYSAPEIWQDKPVLDLRSDVFSLGSLLYFCVTGGDHPPRVLSSTRIPERYGPLILKCRAVNPNERYATVSEVEEALLSLSENKTQEVKPSFQEQDSIKISITQGPHQESVFSSISPAPDPQSLPPTPASESIFTMVIEGLNLYLKLIRKFISSPFKSLFLDLREHYSDAWEELRDETGEIKRKALQGRPKPIKQKPQPSLKSPEEAQPLNEPVSQATIQDLAEVVSIPETTRLPQDQPIGLAKKSSQNTSSESKIGLPLTLIFIVFAVLALAFYLGSTGSKKEVIPPTPSIPKSKLQEIVKTQTKKQVFFQSVEGLQIQSLKGDVSIRKDPLAPWKPLDAASSLPVPVYFRTTSEGALSLVDSKRKLSFSIGPNSELNLLGYPRKTLDSEAVLTLILEDGDYYFNTFRSKTLLNLELDQVKLGCRSAHFKIVSRRGRAVYKVIKGALNLEFANGIKLILFPKESLEVVHGIPKQKQDFKPNLVDWKTR